MKSIVFRVMSVCVLIGLALSLSGCIGIPKGTRDTMSVGRLQLLIKGAGIVHADTEKTTFRIKCGNCGFEAEEITVDTPSVGHPYVLNWTCPKCQHRQTVIIEASGL